jgi:hypothetical protein
VGSLPIRVEKWTEIRPDYNYLMRVLFYKGMRRLRSKRDQDTTLHSVKASIPADESSGDFILFFYFVRETSFCFFMVRNGVMRPIFFAFGGTFGFIIWDTRTQRLASCVWGECGLEGALWKSERLPGT